MRFLIPLFFLCFNIYSQSIVHYVGPVHSNQKNTLFAKEQYIYITSPHDDDDIYIKIKKFGSTEHDVLTLIKGRSISYRVGNDEKTPLIILTEDLGSNLSDKGMMVEGFSDVGLSKPIPIFVETRFQAGNFDPNVLTQYTSWNTKGDYDEPNDCCSNDNGEENYAHIWWNGLWNDLSNNNKLPFIVEFDYNLDSLGIDYIFLGFFDGHSYFMSNIESELNEFTWTESRDIAIGLGGYLVSINTQEEQDQIVDWFEELPFEDQEYGPWIGLFQDPSDPLYSEPSGGWRWDDGSSLNFYDRQQANSSFLKGESASGKTFRLGHGISNIQSIHRRVFFTVLSLEEGVTEVKLSGLGGVESDWENVLGNSQDYVLDANGDYTFFLNQYQTHAFALDNTPGSSEEHYDALVGALLESDKNIVVNVGFWGGSNSWQGNGRDIGFDQIKPIENVSNEYVFLRSGGEININGEQSNTNEYAIVVAHEDNTKIWLHTASADTASTPADHTIDAGEYKILYFGGGNVTSDNQIYVLSNKRVYGYQNMAGQDGNASKQAMMLVSGINPLASNKIDGIYNIEDIATTKFEMELRILSSTGADLKLNGTQASSYAPFTETIEGRDDLSWYLFDNSDLATILPLGPDKRLTIESDGPVYGQYYGYNSVQGLAGYFYSYSDFDEDGITDADDLDDDNDGILDAWEGDEDTDGDGLINRYDLDSDNDGCFDTQEAGFTDQDNNGILGYGSSNGVYVDVRGMVIKNDDNTDVVDGYTLPADLDGSGAPDFRENGFQLSIVTHPKDIILEPCPDTDNIDLFFEAEGEGVNVSYRWQVSYDSGNSWKRIFDVENYEGIIDKKLEIIDFDSSFVGNMYRAIVETRGFVCGVGDTTNAASIKMLPDNDGDCVPDEKDLDDDNDGIFDSEEDTTDIDGDGIINSFDLDTDGDGCFDVVEAGFSDPDDDGILCVSPVVVDSLGVVIGCDGIQECSPLNVTDYNIVGSAQFIETDSSYLLTEELGNQSGAVWSLETVDLSKDFEVKSNINLGNILGANGADGIAFVLQPLSSDQGSTGGGIGYMGITPSVAVEFDTYKWNSNDPDGDHAAIVYDGQTTIHNNEYVFTSEIADNIYHEVIFSWNSKDKNLTVSWDGNVIISSTKDIVNEIFDGNSEVYYGFTAATGGSVNNQSIIITGTCSTLGGGQPVEDGYTDPLDLDINGVKDYREVSLSPLVTLDPEDVRIAIETQTFFFVGVDYEGPITYQWQLNLGEGWINLADTSVYSGINSDTLKIDSVVIEMDQNQYRVVVSNQLYCSEPVYCNSVVLNCLPDNDKDKIPDIDDLDDDNDGIFDVDEGIGDVDSDGIPNAFDLDSDGDGCLDVIEAGFTDGDGDGILGTSPVDVDSLGTVIPRLDGYVNPLDRDSNAVYDFLEKGSAITITSDPLSVSIIETRDARYEVEYSVDGTVIFQWMVSEDEGENWVDIADNAIYKGTNSSVLTLTNAPLEFNEYQFKVKISTPAFVCDEDVFSSVALTVLPDNDKDGIADEDDLDDDNDGIYDIYEGDGDADGDGIINSFDLDSDGDGCFDVIESGCVDPDNDGILGNSPVKVDGLGLVLEEYIAKYDFSGNSADSSGNNFNGTINGPSLDTDRFGIPNSAYLFDGVDDYISVVHDSLLNLGLYERFSISLWVKPYDLINSGETKPFIQKYSVDSSWVYKYEYVNDTSELIFDVGDKDAQISSAEILLNQFDWYHLVIQKDGDVYTHFVNGDTVLSFVDSTGIGFNNSPVIIGGSQNSGDYLFGIIDDIIISGNYGFCNYKVPEDNDNSGVYDFLEFGGPLSLDSISESQIITEQSDTYFTVSSSSLSNISYTWELSADGGITWQVVKDSLPYSGVSTDTLKVLGAPLTLSENLYRVKVSTPSYRCGDDITSISKLLTVLPDNDVDGIPDTDDVDDDNDGIYDYVEGNGDSDGDGIINSFDQDSDGDGCDDVIEAGFSDPDGNGMLGGSPVVVDENGKVISGGDGNGYTDPVDRDSNFISDYLDFGSAVKIIVEPSDVYIVERSDSSVSVSVEVKDSDTKVLFMWQVSDNGGMTWEGLSNTSNVLEIMNADISYDNRIFRVIVSTPSFICGGQVVSDPFRIKIAKDFDVDFVGDFSDLDDDNDGIYDSLECENNSSILISGDVDTLITSGYPIVAQFTGNTGSGGSGDIFGNNINVSMFVSPGDVYESCYYVSDMNFDDGIQVRVDGKTILSFNQYHWDVTRGKADPYLTREFNGGIFGNKWFPWDDNTKIELVIRDGSIKLYSETIDGQMVDVIPYMDNTVEGWVLDKSFSFSCKEGFNLEVKNTNHDGPSTFVSDNKIYAYVCNDVDSDGRNNNRDFDSDDDDCFDVREAGFKDNDNDGMLGNSPVTVDSLGLVDSDSGYELPVDNDNNGTYDFLEEGFSIDILSSPEMYALVREGDTFSLFVDVNLTNRFVYQWQVQDEYSLFWKNVSDTLKGLTSYSGSNTNLLKISGVNFDKNQLDNIFLSYRLIISSPSYLCEDDILTSPFEVEVYHKDLHIPNGFSPNNDGVNDTWVIRGLEQYPNHKIRIYNRWNNRVFERRKYNNDWDGTNQMKIFFGDGALPKGTYFYILDLGDDTKPLTGFIFIKRD